MNAQLFSWAIMVVKKYYKAMCLVLRLEMKKVKEAKKLFDIETTKELLDFALSELLRSQKRRRILELKGKVNLEIDLKKHRGSR